MKHSRIPLLLISTEKQWRAMTSVVRMEMVVSLISIGPCSVSELAEHLDRPADGLYHHLRKLVTAGFFVEVDSRKVGKQTEVIYDVVAEDFKATTNIANKKNRQHVIKLFQMVLRQATRTMETAIETQTAVFDSPEANVRFNLLSAWLDDEQMQSIRQHLSAINEIMYEGIRRKRGKLYSVLTYLMPVVRTRSANWKEET